jgi:pectate lyase
MNARSGFLFLLTICFLFLPYQGCTQTSREALNYGLPVLPGVTGFGLDTKGGQGGKIIRVTNLNREGNGSLSEAIQSDGPRIIVFEVAGVIDLERKSLHIQNPFMTIAGQTAPYPGITLIRGGIGIVTHDVILQHIKVRPGEAEQEKKSGWEVDGIATAGGAYNVIVDHCSATWSTDENLSASGPRFDGADVNEWRNNTSHKVVFSNCIIAEGLSNSTHSKGEHSKGSLIHDNATEILIIGNLYACNVQRNPLFKGGVQGLVINNYIFNPGNAAVHFGLVPQEWEGHEWITGKMGVEGNVIEYGPDTRSKMAAGSFRGPVELYWKDNKIIAGTEITELSGNFTRVENRPFWPQGFTAMPVDKVKESVLANAGAFPWKRDEIDKRIIAGAMDETGSIINSEKEVGGYPVIKPVYRKFNENEWDLITLIKKER